MKIVALIRVKDAILTIIETLYNLSELVDEIVIVDNGSTDGTQNIYQYFPKIVKVAHTKGFHEGRDKHLAHQLAKKRQPDWMIYLDADEVFESVLTRAKLEKICQGRHDAVGIRLFHFWLSKQYYRADDYYFLGYTVRPFPRIFKNTDYIYFDKDKRVHTWFAKGYKRLKTTKYRIKHYGFLYKNEIDKKIKLYQSLNFKEDKNDYASYTKSLKQIKRNQWRSANFPGGEFYLTFNKWYWSFRSFYRELTIRQEIRKLVRKNQSYPPLLICIFMNIYRLIEYRLFNLSLDIGLHHQLQRLRKNLKKLRF